MSKFKFAKKDDKFRWEDGNLILEFSSPSMQGFSDYVQVDSIEDIMYYYYTVKVFKKYDGWDDSREECLITEMVSERSTHDFPSITELKWILEYQLNDDTRVDGQRNEYTSGDVKFSKSVSTEGFACDDFYEIKKIVDSDGKNEQYVVYCGVTYDAQGDLNSVGIRTPYVNRDDIKQLLKCVNGFIDYTLEKHNSCNDKCNEAFCVKGNKLYQYQYQLSDEGVNHSVVESIFVEGDTLNIITVVDNKQVEYDEVVVVSIDNTCITLEDGKVVSVDTIVYVDNDVDEEKECFGLNDVAKDFHSILSEVEISEFKETDSTVLLEKYLMAIIDRTNMCLESHRFNISYDSGNRVEAVTPIVLEVINLIKNWL